ncbi:MAG: hypothetical protein V1912_11280 [bacterium]
MSAPKNARQTSRGRLYEFDGKRYWSVTTIIKNGLPQPQIKEWAQTSVAEFAVANHRQIAAMLGTVRVVRLDNKKGSPIYVVSDPDAVAGAISWLRNAPYREGERKKNVGSAIHEAIEASILGTPRSEPDPDLLPQMEAFHQWEADFKPEYLMAEASVYSDQEQYAGTLDIIARIGGRVLVTDTKSGKAVYADAALQLSAYSRADFIGLRDGTKAPLPSIDGAAVLHLPSLIDQEITGAPPYSFVPVRIDDDVYKAFLYCRENFRWMEEISRTVLGTPLLGPDGVTFLFPDGSAAEEEEAYA